MKLLSNTWINREEERKVDAVVEGKVKEETKERRQKHVKM